MIKSIKLLLLTLGFATVAFATIAPTVSAFNLFSDPCSKDPGATVCQEDDPSQNQSKNSIYGEGGIATTIVNILSIVIGIAAIIVIIVAGIQYMVSTGDPTKVNNAKNAILYALAGLVIAVAARTIVVFVINKLN